MALRPSTDSLDFSPVAPPPAGGARYHSRATQATASEGDTGVPRTMTMAVLRRNAFGGLVPYLTQFDTVTCSLRLKRAASGPPGRAQGEVGRPGGGGGRQVAVAVVIDGLEAYCSECGQGMGVRVVLCCDMRMDPRG